MNPMYQRDAPEHVKYWRGYDPSDPPYSEEEEQSECEDSKHIERYDYPD